MSKGKAGCNYFYLKKWDHFLRITDDKSVCKLTLA